jgi:hypothetical protein
MTSQLAERSDASALLGGRGRGPGGRPTGLPLPTGLCPVPGCGDQIDQTRLMCQRDWYHVPKRLRDQVWRTWRSGQEANSHKHQRAVLQAITAARLTRLQGLLGQLAHLWLRFKTSTKALTWLSSISMWPGVASDERSASTDSPNL